MKEKLFNLFIKKRSLVLIGSEIIDFFELTNISKKTYFFNKMCYAENFLIWTVWSSWEETEFTLSEPYLSELKTQLQRTKSLQELDI